VIIEANACGLPVIVTDTPLMHELVKQGENGVLVKPGSAEALAGALKDFFDKRDQFNKKLIAESAQRYSYKEIGKMFFNEYISLIDPNSQ
jgi:glycosyltransferase involved in cell wall biosynthesis